jgi:tripartite-type tricarboxylate transporter receptor subunit TctC
MQARAMNKSLCFPRLAALTSVQRRHVLTALAASTVTLLHNPGVFGQTARPVRIVVPFGAGGIADLTIRAIVPALAQELGQAVIVENKPGAGGIVAGEQVVRSEPDGSTLLLVSNATAVSASLFKQLPFDALNDLRPIGLMGNFDLGLIDGGPTKFADVAALLSFGRANPGKLNIGSINIGSTQNLAAELFKINAQLDAQVVPFSNTPAVVTALRSGDIDVAVEILGPLRGQLQAGAVRVLAVMGDKRSAGLASVPTLREAGVRGQPVTSWNGLAAPAKTPGAVVDRLHAALQRALAQPEVLKRLAELGVEPLPGSPAQMRSHWSEETQRWGDVIRRARIAQQ